MHALQPCIDRLNHGPVIVDLPTCRDKDYLETQLQFASDVTKGRLILNLFPKVLKP
jgi:hypothetical protein